MCEERERNIEKYLTLLEDALTNSTQYPPTLAIPKTPDLDEAAMNAAVRIMRSQCSITVIKDVTRHPNVYLVAMAYKTTPLLAKRRLQCEPRSA